MSDKPNYNYAYLVAKLVLQKGDKVGMIAHGREGTVVYTFDHWEESGNGFFVSASGVDELHPWNILTRNGNGCDFRFSQLDHLQAAHTDWLAKLGSQPVDLQMRLRRFAEEAAELCQAAGLDEETFMKVARDSYSRPVGETGQEIGGTMVTLLCLAGVTGHSVDYEVRREFDRINTPEMIEKISAKQRDKAARGI